MSVSSLHELDLSDVRPYVAHPFHITHSGWDTSPDGHRIGFTDYYMTYDGKPFYAVAGEFHFSRMDPDLWDDELAKMASEGVNIVSTYVFWNHHEETKGIWDFTGRRNLRRFIQLCARHHLFVIVRMGPFDHGEARNGGIPDWVFSQPCEARSTDPVFLNLVRDLYRHIAQQITGLYFKDGGPIIAAQLDNEYMHSSAPWEFLSGVTEDWVPGGHEGVAYIEALRKIAESEGISVPFYTNTGWGGAPVPDNVLPMWGGYPYRPWLFYSRHGTHPLTDEYLYRDYHSDSVKRNEDFDPSYPPHTKPYVCCEMGGGMMVSYNYRFVIPMKSVDAMANGKMASGCNFLGYYMYQGGTNPVGRTYLNEGQVSKVSYDYQAPLGEFGQMRESGRRLRLLHLFAETFSDRLVPLKTVLPQGQDQIDPADATQLRWNVRTDGRHGFVFIDNFQDHAIRPDVKDQTIDLTLSDGSHVRFEHVGLAGQENCILPFHMDLDGIDLVSANAQPVTVLEQERERTFIFLLPQGMPESQFRFASDVTRTDVAKDEVSRLFGHAFTPVDFCEVSDQAGHRARILCLTRAQADRMLVLSDRSAFVLTPANAQDRAEASAMRDADGKPVQTICDAVPSLFQTVGATGPRLVLETTSAQEAQTAAQRCAEDVNSSALVTYPSGSLQPVSGAVTELDVKPEVTALHDNRWQIRIPSKALDALGKGTVEDLRLNLKIIGDIGWLFCGTHLINDVFCNGDVWQIGLKQYRQQILDNDGVLVLVITPLKKGAKVTVESSMAARMESSQSTFAALDSAHIETVYRVEFEEKK
jgi:hypothetical protein